jgi:hypothetical protein
VVNIGIGLGIGYIHGIEKVFLFGNTTPEGSSINPHLPTDNVFVTGGDVYILPF